VQKINEVELDWAINLRFLESLYAIYGRAHASPSQYSLIF